MSFWTRADRTPPILVRLLARHKHGAAMTDEEIAAASGIPQYAIGNMAQQTDWRHIDIYTMRRYLVACGCDFENLADMRRLDSYLRSKPTWRHLRRSPKWAAYYEPLMRRYLDSLKHPKTPTL